MSDTPYSCLLPRESGCLLPLESSSSFYPHFGQCTGTKRASNWHSMRTQKSNSNLHFFVHTLFCLATTTVCTFIFFTREQDRCVRSSSQHLLVIVIVDLSHSFWAAHGYKTGIKLVLNENSKIKLQLSLFCSYSLLPGHYYSTHFHFFTREQDRCIRLSAQHLLVLCAQNVPMGYLSRNPFWT
jgi:hypothetical protein